MSYQMTTTIPRRSLRRNRNYVKYGSTTTVLGPITNVLMIAVMVSILGLIYLTQVTQTSNYGYEVNKLLTSQSDLVKENESLQVESARLQALETIKTSKVAKSLQTVSGADYAN